MRTRIGFKERSDPAGKYYRFDRASRESLRKNIIGILVTSRPSTSLIAGFVPFIIISLHGNFTFSQNLLFALPMVLTTMIGFILNDVYDKEKDAVSKKNRPIARGDLSIFHALLTALCLAVLSLVLTFEFVIYPANLILVAVLLGVTAYSIASTRHPLSKGFLTALLCCAPIVYGSIVAGITIPLGIYVACYLFVLGRELLLDIRDSVTDKAFNLRTIATLMDTKSASFIAWVVMLLGLTIASSSFQTTAALIFAGAGWLFMLVALADSLTQGEKAFALTQFVFVFNAIAIALG